MMTMVFYGLPGFFYIIFSKNSQTDSFLEFYLKSTTFSPFIALEAEGTGSHLCGLLLHNWFIE